MRFRSRDKLDLLARLHWPESNRNVPLRVRFFIIGPTTMSSDSGSIASETRRPRARRLSWIWLIRNHPLTTDGHLSIGQMNGDQFTCGRHMANTWRGNFPYQSVGVDNFEGIVGVWDDIDFACFQFWFTRDGSRAFSFCRKLEIEYSKNVVADFFNSFSFILSLNL